jgi:hypothetical protein
MPGDLTPLGWLLVGIAAVPTLICTGISLYLCLLWVEAGDWPNRKRK